MRTRWYKTRCQAALLYWKLASKFKFAQFFVLDHRGTSTNDVTSGNGHIAIPTPPLHTRSHTLHTACTVERSGTPRMQFRQPGAQYAHFELGQQPQFGQQG